MGDPGCEEVDAAITAADVALSAVRRIADSQRKLEATGKLRDGLRSRSDEAARIGHAEAVRIYEAENLSLGKLAKRTGISKARADQITKAARQKETDDE